MKEKLITFTRNRKNLIGLCIIAMLLFLTSYWLYNIELSSITIIGLILILIGGFYPTFDHSVPR